MMDMWVGLGSALASFIFLWYMVQNHVRPMWVGLGSALASFIFLWYMVQNHVRPNFLRHRLTDWANRLAAYFNPYVHITISEYGAGHLQRSELFVAVESYLSRTLAHHARKLKAKVGRNGMKVHLSIDDHQVTDNYNGATVWWYASKKYPRSSNVVARVSPGEDAVRGSSLYQLVFHHRHRDLIMGSYLPHIVETKRRAVGEHGQLRLFTNTISGGSTAVSVKHPTRSWSHIPFEHPATFNTLAMDSPAEKMAIMEDLSSFRNAKEDYARIGKSWRRVYLLFGPPGTGKSTMIAAVANFMDYDVYDLDLTVVKNNTELRKAFVETMGRSIIVMRDIHRFAQLSTTSRERKKSGNKKLPDPMDLVDEAGGNHVTLSGLLDLVDGLWSAWSSEGIIIILTTNHKDRLHPALQERVNKHIEMTLIDMEPKIDEEKKLVKKIKKDEQLVEAAGAKKAKKEGDDHEGGEDTMRRPRAETPPPVRMGHDETTKGPPSLVEASAGAKTEGPDSNDWSLDTSAWTHRTFNLRLLRIRDVRSSPEGCGMLRADRFKVPDVHYIQGQARNVISVAQLARQGFTTVFEPTCAYVRDRASGKDVGKARVRHGLYVLDYLLINNQPLRVQDVANASMSRGMSIDELPGASSSEPQVESHEDRDSWFGMSPLERSSNDPAADAFMTLAQEEQLRNGTNKQFFMDSGARHHMTCNGDVLKAYHDDLYIDPPMEYPRVGGIGFIASAGGSLDRVLFAPDSAVNLVSVRQLTEDYFVRVVFQGDEFFVEKLDTDERIGDGHIVDSAYVVTHLDVGAASDWILDTFARLHHTSDRRLLRGLHNDVADLPAASMANELQILGNGYVKTERYNVPDVHYVVGSKRNIISVAQLAKRHGLVTVLEPTCCHVKVKETGRIVGRGRLCKGVYVLDYLIINIQQSISIQAREGGDRGGRSRDNDSGGGRGSSAGDEHAGRGGGDQGGGGRGGGRGDGGGEDGEGQEEEAGEDEEGQEEDEEEEEEQEEEEGNGEEQEDEGEGQEEEEEEIQEGADLLEQPQDDMDIDAVPTSRNEQRPNEFFLASVAPCFHVTWNSESMIPYPLHLRDGSWPEIPSFDGVFGIGSNQSGDEHITVTDTGYINNANIMLDAVLLAPNSQRNLVSVVQLQCQYGVTVEMFDYIKISKKINGNSVEVGRGYINNSLQYVLSYFQPLPRLLYAESPVPNFNFYRDNFWGSLQQ